MNEIAIAAVLTGNTYNINVGHHVPRTLESQYKMWIEESEFSPRSTTIAKYLTKIIKKFSPRSTTIAKYLTKIIKKHGKDALGYWLIEPSIVVDDVLVIYGKYYLVTDIYDFGNTINKYMVFVPLTLED